MHTTRSTWPGAVIGVVLIGGGLLMNYRMEVPSMSTQVALANQGTVMADKLNRLVSTIGEYSTVQFHPAVVANNQPASRFVVAFPGAVLDKHTGLVWEEMPDATPRTRTDATRYCIDKTVGGTIGWRLPSMAELKGLQDSSLAQPFVQASVFTDAQSTTYWSASKAPIGASFVHFVDGREIGGNTPHTFPAWCVRGGVNTEQF